MRLDRSVSGATPVLLAALAFHCAGGAQSAEPAKDHPLVGRYDGSVMEVYKPAAYDEVGLFKEPFQNWEGGQPELLKLEGKVSAYCYRLPAGRSLLEVQRNYEASLKAKGFTLMFGCATSNGSCYKPRPGRPMSTDAYDLARAGRARLAPAGRQQPAADGALL